MTTTGNGKVALVTGANKGIGKAIAKGLARKGFTVFLGARDLDKGEAAAVELKREGDVRFCTAGCHRSCVRAGREGNH